MIDDHPFYPHIPGGNQVGNGLLTSGPMRTPYRSPYGQAFRVSKTCFGCGEPRRAHARVGDGVVKLMEEFG